MKEQTHNHGGRGRPGNMRAEHEAIRPVLKGGFSVRTCGKTVTATHQRTGKAVSVRIGRRGYGAMAAELRDRCGCPDAPGLMKQARADMAAADQARRTGQASISRARMQVAKSRMDRARALQG